MKETGGLPTRSLERDVFKGVVDFGNFKMNVGKGGTGRGLGTDPVFRTHQHRSEG